MESPGVGDSGDFGGLDRSAEELILRLVLIGVSAMFKDSHSDHVYNRSIIQQGQ